jgi:adenylate cyclase
MLAFNAACKILEMSETFILGGKPVELGIGLHTGRAILGNIGSQTKIEYTAVGDTVNTAARLQELTRLFQEFPIIMSRDTWNDLVGHPYHHAIKNLGMQEMRGKKERLEAFGFKPLKDRPLSAAQGDRGFIPLQRIKGV